MLSQKGAVESWETFQNKRANVRSDPSKQEMKAEHRGRGETTGAQPRLGRTVPRRWSRSLLSHHVLPPHMKTLLSSPEAILGFWLRSLSLSLPPLQLHKTGAETSQGVVPMKCRAEPTLPLSPASHQGICLSPTLRPSSFDSTCAFTHGPINLWLVTEARREPGRETPQTRLIINDLCT